MLKEYLVFNFLDQQLATDRPCLLALSGGPDSMALLYLLIAYQKKRPNFSFHIAHVNHNYRKESNQEAEYLGQLSDKYNLVYHETVLEPIHRDLENSFRKKRYQFFIDLHQKWNFEALLTAHHRDDQVETVLKRILEGAAIYKLTGIAQDIYRKDLRILRPLLPFSKSEMELFLKKQHINYFFDESNQDTKFLRARMRCQMIPDLKRVFGKSFEDNLCYLASISEKLSDYLKLKTEPFLKNILRGPFGSCLDLTGCEIHPFEYRFLLTRYFEEEGVRVTKTILEDLVNRWGYPSTKPSQFRVKDYLIYIDRACTFVINTKANYTFQLEKSETNSKLNQGWKSLFIGEKVSIKSSLHAQVQSVEQLDADLKQKLYKLRSQAHIPVFLRSQIPVIIENGRIISDFLVNHAIKVREGFSKDHFISLKVIKK